MKQHLRFFTLALLCAVCSAGWGANFKFAFAINAIPTGKIYEHLSMNEVPNTFFMPQSYTSDEMPWTFDMETDATDPIYCTFSAGFKIGTDDKNGVINHVKKVILKSLGNFEKVSKISFSNLKFNNTNGAGTVTLKVGGKDCGTHVITGGSTQSISISGSPSGPVEIIIDQPETTYGLSISNFTITANSLKACELSFSEVPDGGYSVDFKESSFTAPTLDNPKNLSGISYFSTNPALAAVDEATGKVTLGQANGGSATIYAFFKGNDTYMFGSASFTINMSSNVLWSEDFSSNSLDGYDCNKASISQTTNAGGGGTAPELKLTQNGSSFTKTVDLQGFYGDFMLSFKAKFTTFDFYASVGNPGEPYRKYSIVYVPIYDIPKGTKSITITITRTTKDLYVDDITLTGGTFDPVCWMTYCSPSALDFTKKADYYNAYIATSYKSDGSVGLTKIEKVPAGMGVLVKALDNRLGFLNAFDPASVATTETIEQGEYTNLLKGVTSDQELPTTGTMTFNGEQVACTNFILAKRDGVVGFYKSAGGTLKANKAYLQLPTDLISGSNSISFYVEDGTTAIQNVTTHPATTDDAWYTLQGVRVAQPTRGLYIHNGKKVVVK